jgi:hypothetical protein
MEDLLGVEPWDSYVVGGWWSSCGLSGTARRVLAGIDVVTTCQEGRYKTLYCIVTYSSGHPVLSYILS